MKDFYTPVGVLKVTATVTRKLTCTNVSADGSEELVRKVAAHITHGGKTQHRSTIDTSKVLKESVLAYQATAGTRKRKAEKESVGRNP